MIKIFFQKFEEEECIKMINKHINNKRNIIKKNSTKETEKTKSYLEIIKTIPENDSDIFFLDVITSFIYYEACEEKVIEIKCDDINILSEFFNILLKRIESYKQKYHKY
jgi:hypothetical protein